MMSNFEMPWYGALNKALAPLDPYVTILLLLLAALTVYIALTKNHAFKWLWFVYWISP